MLRAREPRAPRPHPNHSQSLWSAAQQLPPLCPARYASRGEPRTLAYETPWIRLYELRIWDGTLLAPQLRGWASLWSQDAFFRFKRNIVPLLSRGLKALVTLSTLSTLQKVAVAVRAAPSAAEAADSGRPGHILQAEMSVRCRLYARC